MGKVLARVLIVAGLWLATGALTVSVPLRILLLGAGALVVHAVWERLFPGPLYLGARAVAEDDPLMSSAIAEARRTLSLLRALYPEHREDTMVRYPFQTDAGTLEHLWGDLVELSDSTAKVFTRTPPISHEGPFERTMTVPVEALSDWQIEFRDGTLRGGFTNRAMFKIYEREQGHPHPQMKEQLARFRDVTEGWRSAPRTPDGAP